MKLSDDPGASGASLDEQRLRAAALGDEQAWAQLVSSYEQEVWELARACTARADEATAVCEVVWRRLAQSLAGLDDEPVQQWLHRMTRVESERARLRAGHRPGEPADAERRRGSRTTQA